MEKVIDEAEKYQKERNIILADNEELHNTVKNFEKDTDVSLDSELQIKKRRYRKRVKF